MRVAVFRSGVMGQVVVRTNALLVRVVATCSYWSVLRDRHWKVHLHSSTFFSTKPLDKAGDIYVHTITYVHRNYMHVVVREENYVQLINNIS